MYINFVVSLGFLLISAFDVVAQTSTTTSLPPLASGCNSDNVVRALQHHFTDASPYCQSMVPTMTYKVNYQGTYTTTVTGYSVTTSTYIARYSQFTNVYSGNRVFSGQPSQSPITYTNNKPSLWTVQNAFPTPSYLTPYDIYHIFTGCTCLVTPATTSTVNGYYTTVTQFVNPTTTYTNRVEGARIYNPIPTYGALCNPSIYVNYGGLLVQTISATRAVQTISPIPTVRYRFDCCQLCADTYNCLWWRHSVSGACTYVWATDVNSNHSEYDKCPNGYGGLVFGPAANPILADSYGIGTCGTGNQAFGEDESSQDSTEEMFQFQQNCAVFGGSYCS